MSTAVEEITISNVGPIERARVPYMRRGGVIVFYGPQGCGKSTALEALNAAATGKGRVPVKDGELRAEVNAFGVTMVVGKSTRRSGEPEVIALDSKLSVADLVDPGIKSADAADAHRIKALITLTGLKPSAELFYKLADGSREEFEKLVTPATLASDDLVVMAERIKRDLESKARTEESNAEHAEGRARGAREAAAGADLTGECDSTVLQTALEGAIREQSKLTSEAETARKATMAAKLAKDQIEDREAKYDGPTLEAATETERIMKGVQEDAEALVREIEVKLNARAAFEKARNEYAATISARKSAEHHENLIKQWRDQIAASIPPAPSAEQLTDASDRVIRARQAVEQGALVRKAKEHIAEDIKHRETAAGHRKKAMQLREAAKGTDEILSEVVAKTGSPLRVEAGRLVLATARAKKTLFAELSDGERWKLALDIAIDAVGDRGFLTIPQWAWGELQPANRKAIAEHLRARGVLAYTAEAADGDGITAEEYDAD